MFKKIKLINVGVSLNTFFSNRWIEIKNISRTMRKKWKSFKGKFYYKATEYIINRINKRYEKSQSKLNSMLNKRDKLLGKYYLNGGSYQITQEVEIKMSGVKL